MSPIFSYPSNIQLFIKAELMLIYAESISTAAIILFRLRLRPLDRLHQDHRREAIIHHHLHDDDEALT